MTAHTHDDGFREIQLSGKQLIFLFMVITISGVVIFLAGVFVGRDVRGERAALAQAQTVEAPPTPDVVPQPPTVTSSVAAQVDPKTPPPAPIDDLSYPQRLDADKPPVDKLAPAAKIPSPAKDAKGPDAVSAAAKTTTPPPAAKPVPAPAASVASAAAASSAPAPAAEKPAAGTGAPGNGFVVQIAAVNVRGEADAIAKRLTSKGYAAFVQSPGGAASVFRVRVGTFKTRREADAVASKLQKEEKYKPWVTR